MIITLRSVSQEKTSVQSAFFAYAALVVLGFCDVATYAWCSYPCTTLSRAAFCLLCVYGYPGSWLAGCSAVMNALLHTQAAGWELMLCCSLGAVLSYVRMYAVTTRFAYTTLFMAAYVLFELLAAAGASTSMSLPLIGWHVALVLGVWYGILKKKAK